MTDYISRADAINAFWEDSDIRTAEVRATLKALPSAEPIMTEEVREALMRLTMCAREECDMCKYKDECGYDFQYKISTDNMNTLSDALLRSKCEVDAKSADAEPKTEHDREWIIGCIKHDGFIKTDRFDKANQIILEALSADAVAVVRCKDCRWWQDDYMGTWCGRLSGVRFTNADDFCSHGERREP